MSMTKEEIALQLTLKALECNLVNRMGPNSQDGIGTANVNTANSVAEVYNSILSLITPYE